MGRLDKRNIFITGGSLGIGFSVAKKCAEEGAKVIIAARNLDNLVTAKSRLASISGGHEIRVLDVSSLNDVQIVVNELKEKEYKIDGLVNCAGIYGPIGASHNISPELFIQAININLIGTFLVCHCFVNAFLDKGLKKIVNFSGGGAASPFPNFSAYSASKVAIVRLTENLSIELKEKKININAVAPGFVVTRLHEETLAAGDKAGKDFLMATKKQIESGGVPPDKAASLVAFLLSDKSNGITGKFISAPWDPWENEEFQERLKNNGDLATLRRIDNKYFKRTNGSL